MQPGVDEIFTGTVTGIAPYGAFVKLNDGRSGMVHISEISSAYVKKIEEYLSVGDSVKVVLLESNNGKLSFSIKRAVIKNLDLENTDISTFKNANCNKFHEQVKDRNSFRGNNRVDTNKFNRFGKNQNNPNNSLSFENMMSKFKQTSDEKLAPLKKNVNNRRSVNRKTPNTKRGK